MRVEVEREGGVRRAGERAGDGRRAARARERGDHRGVLVVVGPDVAGRVVQDTPVPPPRLIPSAVREDRIQPDLVARAGRGVDVHADAGAKGDRVAGRGRAADRVVR